MHTDYQMDYLASQEKIIEGGSFSAIIKAPRMFSCHKRHLYVMLWYGGPTYTDLFKCMFLFFFPFQEAERTLR